MPIPDCLKTVPGFQLFLITFMLSYFVVIPVVESIHEKTDKNRDAWGYMIPCKK